MSGGDSPLLQVSPTPDGVWSVNESGPARAAIAYFPSKWGAMRHAVRAARAKGRARVTVLERGGRVRASREYSSPDPGPAEVP